MKFFTNISFRGFCLFVLIILMGSFELHKFYSSQTDMKYNNDTESLEITISLFTDDFEKALENKSESKLFLGSQKENKTTDSLIYSYFKNHFHLTQENNPVHFFYIGKEVKLDNITYIYLESKDFKDDLELMVKSTVLLELYEKQVNIINYENDNLQLSKSLNKDNTSTTFKSAF